MMSSSSCVHIGPTVPATTHSRDQQSAYMDVVSERRTTAIELCALKTIWAEVMASSFGSKPELFVHRHRFERGQLSLPHVLCVLLDGLKPSTVEQGEVLGVLEPVLVADGGVVDAPLAVCMSIAGSCTGSRWGRR